ncbi:MAG TPA: RidA family protein [Candidatus Acidoferrales bacterium]|nr:RidA family protein [Candidatus Acidoferrales bacterium]
MPSSAKRVYFSAPAGFGPLPFSNGVLVGGTFYMSGHLGLDPATKKIPANVEQEIRFMLDGFRGTLSRAALAMEDLVFVQVFCPDVSLFDQFNSVYRTYFPQDFPARAFIGSGPLLFGAHFEIQGIAAKRARAQRPAQRRRK